MTIVSLWLWLSEVGTLPPARLEWVDYLLLALPPGHELVGIILLSSGLVLCRGLVVLWRSLLVLRLASLVPHAIPWLLVLYVLLLVLYIIRQGVPLVCLRCVEYRVVFRRCAVASGGFIVV